MHEKELDGIFNQSNCCVCVVQPIRLSYFDPKSVRPLHALKETRAITVILAELLKCGLIDKTAIFYFIQESGISTI